MDYGQTFDENSTLDGILAELIIPAVKSKEPAIRERGMIALGLCCLIHRVRLTFILIPQSDLSRMQKLVAGSFSLFLNQVEKASPSLKVKALQIVFDMLTMYERDLMGPRPEVEVKHSTWPMKTVNAATRILRNRSSTSC
jgi:condensin complex subunit 3